MQVTKVALDEQLPLSCCRNGVCCFGKVVFLNAWELHSLAKERGIAKKEFRDAFTKLGGAQLRFDGVKGWKGLSSCNLYEIERGCSVHVGRPLACRLFPLGRILQFDKTEYMFVGETFPCLEACAEVLDLPQKRVDECLKEQEIELYDRVQRLYLEAIQDIADIGFVLLLETGLSASGDRKTLQQWRKIGNHACAELMKLIGTEWVDAVMLPEIPNNSIDAEVFIQTHVSLLQEKAQQLIDGLQTMKQFHSASVVMMGVALYMAKSIGANTSTMIEKWIETAKMNGARD